MRKMMMGWMATILAVAAVISAASDLQSQSSTGALKAAELESEAYRLHDQPRQWAYAANLYMAAVQLRAAEDPQAQADLVLAAHLGYWTGDAAGAIAALESAGSRALAGGDIVRAAGIFTDAAWVANKAGLRIDQRRLSRKVVQLADSSELTRAEKRRILSRFRGT